MNTEKPLIITARSEIQGRSVETCNARDLHAFLGIRRLFANWIQDYIRQFGFVEGLDFVVFNKIVKNPQSEGGRPATEYTLTLNMARELCIWCADFSWEPTMRLRKYWRIRAGPLCKSFAPIPTTTNREKKHE